jgi:hypothetical protein
VRVRLVWVDVLSFFILFHRILLEYPCLIFYLKLQLVLTEIFENRIGKTKLSGIVEMKD